MLVVFFAYLLLTIPFAGTVRAAVYSLDGEAQVALRFAGISLKHDVSLALGENGWPLSGAPVWGAPKKRRNEKKGCLMQRLRQMLENTIRDAASIQHLDITLRMGLGEACGTAVAAGGARAAVLSVLSVLPVPRDTMVRVIPDFFSPCFCLHMRCIFALSAGDIILKTAGSVIKRAAEKRFGYAAASHSESHGNVDGKHSGNGRRQYRYRRSG